MKPKPWDVLTTILESRNKLGKDNINILIKRFGRVKFGKMCALYRHVFKQQKGEKKVVEN